MAEPDPQNNGVRSCNRCRGKAIYWETAIVPGDVFAPPGSNRAYAHAQPAWVCMDCGFLEPHDRRTRQPQDDAHQIWRA